MKRLIASLAAAVSLVACGGSSNPVAPSAPPAAVNTSGISVNATGGLVPPLGVGVFEATMLIDGRQIQGANALCPERSGCAALQVFNLTPVSLSSGQHTVTFRLIRHSAEGRVAYNVVGMILVIRGLAPSERITLVERIVSLGNGDSVTYQFTV